MVESMLTPKIRRSTIILVYVIVIGLLVAHGIWHIHHYFGQATAACSRTGAVHQLTVSEQNMSPSRIVAKRCDKLVITATDATNHELAFGPHARHEPYPDFVNDQVLGQGQAINLTLVQSGVYPLHDHVHPNL